MSHEDETPDKLPEWVRFINELLEQEAEKNGKKRDSQND